MNFQETVEYLYSISADYQKYGNSALNYSLEKIKKIAYEVGNPHQAKKFIHIAGTNGKGSVSHVLASCFQQAGFLTGLYTSPHLFSFTERIKINGEPISESFVVDFVESHKKLIEIYRPSFFEFTTILAFAYFYEKKTNIAIIETGLGGRLDATNIIEPELSVITNIGYDHMEILGDTLDKIAFEKAGIIKKNIPVVIGEYNELTFPVFEKVSNSKCSPLYCAFKDLTLLDESWPNQAIIFDHIKKEHFIFKPGLTGKYQKKNYLTAFKALEIYNHLNKTTLTKEIIRLGFENVVKNTGLLGRWQVINVNPKVVLDTAHNYNGLLEVVEQSTSEFEARKITWIVSFSKDKNYSKYTSFLPIDSKYIFCGSKNKRLEDSAVLCTYFLNNGFNACVADNVNEALQKALKITPLDGLIIITGSNFHIAELEPGMVKITH